MTRYAMVVDLNRCVGCQTCTAACKHANATAPGVQWRRVLDIEAGQFPDVRRAFVPVGCMHCDDPPCVDVCPSTATRKRADGIVTIDYDICIGCAYCAVACPYQARFKVERPSYAYGDRRMAHEAVREDPRRIGVAQKCTFCIERVDAGRASGLVPGVAAEASPACVASCIADALHFGDLDDPKSNVSRLISEHQTFRMHEELGTSPNLYYLWDRRPKGNGAAALPMLAEPTPIAAGMAGVAPSHQQSWDWRAAGNFMGGGAGSGLLVATALAWMSGATQPWLALLALALIASGLLCVWLEIGRPWRFLNVYRHAQTSWMTREAIVALPLFATGLLALITRPPLATILLAAAGTLGAVFLYCQARILQAAKGIPAWREPTIVPLVVSTGLAEGFSLLTIAGAIVGAAGTPLARQMAIGLIAVLTFRFIAWRRYRQALGDRGAPTRALAELDRIGPTFEAASHLAAIGLPVVGLVFPLLAGPAFAVAGLLAFAGGWALKFALVTRAAFNQGFAVERMPARGGGSSAGGVKPGWAKARHAG